jgi:hypothetical protein
VCQSGKEGLDGRDRDDCLHLCGEMWYPDGRLQLTAGAELR